MTAVLAGDVSVGASTVESYVGSLPQTTSYISCMPPPAAIPSLECQGVNLRPPLHADAADLLRSYADVDVRRAFGQGPGSVD